MHPPLHSPKESERPLVTVLYIIFIQEVNFRKLLKWSVAGVGGETKQHGEAERTWAGRRDDMRTQADCECSKHA